jgi:hypothetical protein
MPKYQFCSCFSGGWMCLKAPPSVASVHFTIRPLSTTCSNLTLSLSLGCVTVTDILLFVLLCLHTSAWWIGVLHGRQHAGLAPRVGSYAVLQRIRVIAWYLGLLVIACTSLSCDTDVLLSLCTPFPLPWHATWTLSDAAWRHFLCATLQHF